MRDQRPKFLPSFIGAIHAESELRGWWAVVPFVLLICAASAAAVAYFMPPSFWSEEKRELAVAVFSGLLVFNGLVLTLGWTAFSRIYDVLLRAEFGRYLMKNNLFNDYILQIEFMHIGQIGAVIAAGVALIAVLLDKMIPLAIERVVFALTLMLTAYAIKQAVSAVTAMNDLVWQAAFFESNKPAEGGNVTSLERRGG
jgi:hypothetical protein